MLSGELEEARDCLNVGGGVFKTQRFVFWKINTFECLHSENTRASLMRSLKANYVLKVTYSLWLKGCWPAHGQMCRSLCARRLFRTPQEKLHSLVIELRGWGVSSIRDMLGKMYKWLLKYEFSRNTKVWTVFSLALCLLVIALYQCRKIFLSSSMSAEYSVFQWMRIRW